MAREAAEEERVVLMVLDMLVAGSLGAPVGSMAIQARLELLRLGRINAEAVLSDLEARGAVVWRGQGWLRADGAQVPRA